MFHCLQCLQSPAQGTITVTPLGLAHFLLFVQIQTHPGFYVLLTFSPFQVSERYCIASHFENLTQLLYHPKGWEVEMATRSLPRMDTGRCFGLVFLSIFLLPLSVSVACFCYMLREAFSYLQLHTRAQERSQDVSSRRTILVTGVAMAKGLTLARSFYLSGHRVIGADFEESGIPCPGRYSRSLSAFYRLPKPAAKERAAAYVSRLLDVVNAENVDLWVSCSAVSSAIEDAQAKESIEHNTACKCIQFDAKTTSLLHDKASFMAECKETGLPVPESCEVKSKRDVRRVLSKCLASSSERKFILKPVGMDDVNRGNMTLLPLPTESETMEYVSQFPISKSNPWVLQQFIPGGEEYCTHALVIHGEVKCFVACPSTEMLMHYSALDRASPLWKAMLAFTVDFVRRSPRPDSMNGHLSFDFMATEGGINHSGFKRNIYAIECNPRAHTALILFAQQGPEMDAMVRAYLSILNVGSKDAVMHSTNGTGSPNGAGDLIVTPPADATPRYWIGHDLVSLCIHPLLRWGAGSVDTSNLLSSTLELALLLCLWKEGTFEAWDPMPSLCLYHVYWPMAILSSWWHGRHWTRINVSTTKMFVC
ncbi:hypothetical protein GGR54DRAFT_620208 [Hypoxylon sp. NC1633]|nr:hypothetical protein GGR54DRAFT_620208 [Hypoxylon sp. NC1633]